MEDASGKPGKESDEAAESRDIGQGCVSPATDNSGRALEDGMRNPACDSSREMESDETIEWQDTSISSKDHPGRVKSRTSVSSDRSSYKESREGEADGSPQPGVAITPTEEMTEPPFSESTEQPLPETAGLKGHPSILGRVRKESSNVYKLSREALDTVAAEPLQKPLGRSVSMQTDASWLYDHFYKKKKAPKDKGEQLHPENDIYAVLSQDFSSLEILCDMEFKEEFLKLFQESLRTLSSVGPPTILAYRRESARKVLEIKLEKDYAARCQFCGSLLKDIPSFESLEKLAEYGPLFCCQQCRDLQEFFVHERMRYAKGGVELIDISPHKAHGSEAERQKARERAHQRQRERQLAKQFAYMATEQERDIPIVHTTDYNKQLKTISYCMSQTVPSSTGWTRLPHTAVDEQESDDVTYSVSCCDFTIAGGKLLKNKFLQQYYKNGIKFLTMFPDGTAQIFYPSGNLAVIVVKKKEDTGYICIVQADQPENAEIQAVFESSGKGTCYHPNGLVWINITIYGGHYSDQCGNKVRTWYWPNHLQKDNPRVAFKPVFLSLNQNVGVRILGQDKIAISFLAMGKQAKINVGTKVKLSADHHPLPKHVSEEDLILFACRIKILKVFARLHGCLEFPTNNQWAKLHIPSYLSKQTVRLMNLCKECEIASALDNLIMTIVNSPA